MSDEPQPWSVTTWNVHGSAAPKIADLADAIRVEAPDIVVAQEIQPRQAAQLAAALTMRYSWALKHYPYTRLLPRWAEGMAIFTPHALGAGGHTRISDATWTWSSRRRIAQWALVGRADGSALRIYNLHLSSHNAAAERRTEALRVAEIVAEHGDEPPAIVAGDFNDAGDPSIVYTLPGIEHVEPSFTNPSAAPNQLLDHVLLPPDAVDVSVTVPAGGATWAAISDHLPVTVRFGLASSSPPVEVGPAA